MRKGFRAPSGRANRSDAAALLDKKGITPHMWEVLALVYQARLSRDRGHRAPGMDQTLTALWKRGLVQGKDIPGDLGDWLWSLTDTGVAMLKAGPDA